MTSNQRNWTVLLTTMLVVGAVAMTVIEKNGANETSASLTLRLTAWVSFLTYLLIFVARPLQQLLNSRQTANMLKYRRYFGIAFAGSHTVHLILIVWFYMSISESGPSLQILIAGGIGYVLIYLMLLTSFNGPATAIGPVAWRRLHKVGLFWLGFIFAITFVPKFLARPSDLTYLMSTLLIFAAFGIRVTAFLRHRNH